MNGPTDNAPYPQRKPMNHRGPIGLRVEDAIYFVTIAAKNRAGTAFLDQADALMTAARFNQTAGKWFLHLFLLMPDHLHMLVHVPPDTPLTDVIGNWKRFLTLHHGIAFQANFFDTRIRDDAHFQEKWNYICRNPVARGLCASPREWPYSIAFDRTTGEERPHR